MDTFEHITADPAFCRHVKEDVHDGRLYYKHLFKPKIYYKEYQLFVLKQPEEWREAIPVNRRKRKKRSRHI